MYQLYELNREFSYNNAKLKAISIPTHLEIRSPSTLEKMAKFICDCVLNNVDHVGVRMSYCYRNQLSNLKASLSML